MSERKADDCAHRFVRGGRFSLSDLAFVEGELILGFDIYLDGNVEKKIYAGIPVDVITKSNPARRTFLKEVSQIYCSRSPRNFVVHFGLRESRCFYAFRSHFNFSEYVSRVNAVLTMNGFSLKVLSLPFSQAFGDKGVRSVNLYYVTSGNMGVIGDRAQ